MLQDKNHVERKPIEPIWFIIAVIYVTLCILAFGGVL